MIYSYSISKIREVAVGTIIYQLHVSALIGHLQVGIRQRKISIISIVDLSSTVVLIYTTQITLLEISYMFRLQFIDVIRLITKTKQEKIHSCMVFFRNEPHDRHIF